VLFASRYSRLRAGGGRGKVDQVASVLALEKQTGKLKYTSENVPNSINFHALNVDPRAGRVEFVGHSFKITFALDGAVTASKHKDGPAGEDASPFAPPAPTK
jgi:hypothetical protein